MIFPAKTKKANVKIQNDLSIAYFTTILNAKMLGWKWILIFSALSYNNACYGVQMFIIYLSSLQPL